MKKLLLIPVLALAALASCGGGEKKEAATDDAAFYATQPLKSGEYAATYYTIAQPERKGNFDGRMLVALSPEGSGIYVYENGNRAKIDYRIMLDKPFAAADSGRYVSTDNQGGRVVISPDSAGYVLAFERKGSPIEIRFEKKPLSQGTASEMWNRIRSRLSE